MVCLEQFEELRLRLVAYEAQQELGQTKMKAEVKEQVSEVTDGLKELNNTASVAVGTVASRFDKGKDLRRSNARTEEFIALQKYECGSTREDRSMAHVESRRGGLRGRDDARYSKLSRKGEG